jgi:hypothetical protein
MDDALEKYKSTLRRLHRLSCLGRSGSPAADKLRHDLDDIWGFLSEADQAQALAYSEDLFRDCKVHPEQDSATCKGQNDADPETETDPAGA